MEIGSKRPPIPVPAPATERMTVAVPSAARTELPPARTVQPGKEAEATTRDDHDRRRAAREALAGTASGMVRRKETRIRHDDEAREWVYTQIDTETGRPVSQFPDDATLRRRAFLESLREAGTGGPAERHLVTRIA